MSLDNLLAEWARLLVGSLAKAGIREAIVSPGSRSTPFAWAAHEHPDLVVRSIVDERAAAFFALGQARATGRPSLLICTSGTAAANYLPALVEASLAFVPLIALTADRPFEAQHAGAAQTIDQIKLYGDHCRAYFELGVPDPEPSALAGLSRMAAQAVARATSPEPGPVHLNARARKPLEPSPARSEDERRLSARVDELLRREPPRFAGPSRTVEPRAVDELAEACNKAERGLVVCGPLSPTEAGDGSALAELRRASGWPIYAEATSQYRFGPASLDPVETALGWLLRSPRFLEKHTPDFVLSIGATPTSGPLERLLTERSEIERHVIAAYGRPDAQNSARSVTVGHVPSVIAELATALGKKSRARSEAWASRVRAAAELASGCVGRALDADAGEGAAARAVVQALPEGAVLVVGNSLPIRDVDAYAGASTTKLTVLCQRGANGIDGLIAGAAGAATALRKPTLLLLGDVSLFHDLTSLALARHAETPLVVAVIDNEGGRIFEHLPVRSLLSQSTKAAELWLTPHGLDFELAARLFGLRYAAPRVPSEVTAAVREAMAAPGATLLHLRVPPDSARQLDRKILGDIDAALARWEAA